MEDVHKEEAFSGIPVNVKETQLGMNGHIYEL